MTMNITIEEYIMKTKMMTTKTTITMKMTIKMATMANELRTGPLHIGSPTERLLALVASAKASGILRF